MNIIVKGIVVLETDFSEQDKYIDILTYTHGKISVFCRGIRRKNSVLANKTRLMCFGEFSLYQKTEKYTLNDVVLIESFFEVTQDIIDFSLCSYFLQVSTKLCTESDEKIVRTLIASLYEIKKKRHALAFIKAVFELRVMADAGFLPVLDRCFICEKTQDLKNPVFDVISGGICCHECQVLEQGAKVTTSTLKAMHHIITADVKHIFLFSLGENSIQRLEEITEKYLRIQTDYNFSTLEFYKMIGG